MRRASVAQGARANYEIMDGIACVDSHCSKIILLFRAIVSDIQDVDYS